MATDPITLTQGTTANATDVETKVNVLFTDIDNSNIAAAAGIVFSKLDAATVCSVATAQTITAVKTFNANVALAATKILYFDGDGGGTHMYESSSNIFDIVVGGTLATRMNASGEIALQAADPPTTIKSLNSNSLVKAWARVTFSGGTPSLSGSYNCSGLTDNATGNTEVIFDTDLTSVNYAVSATAQEVGADAMIISDDTRAVGSVDILTRNRSAGTLTDNNFSITICGD